MADNLHALIVAQVITLAFQWYIANTKSIKRLFVATLMFNFANMACYLINGDMAVVCGYVVICIRSVIYVWRDEIKAKMASWLVPVTFILIQLVVGVTSMDNPWQWMSTLIPCYVIYYLWFYEELQRLRVGNVIANTTWGIYNLVTGLYIVAFGRMATAAINVIAYRQNRQEPRE